MEKNIKYDFDDILIVPAVLSEINSRYNGVNLPKQFPIFTAPMDTVVDLNNINEFLKNKINVCLPRTINYDDYNEFISSYPCQNKNIFFSLGFDDIEYHHKNNNFDDFPKNANLLIDVAHGHLIKIVDHAKQIKLHRPDIKIMVGNIANPDTYWYYAENDCVDMIRIGIGNGGGCLTTKQSGVGFSMASLIHETYLVKQKFIEHNNSNTRHQHSLLQTKPVSNIPLIVADGGMKNYSDIIKALALGADYVMVGSLFNKAIESCGDNYLYNIKINKKIANYLFDKGFPIKKHFRGMSTKGAQKAMGKTVLKTSEGVVRYRKAEYHLNGWVNNFEHYLRNAMSYSNAITLDDFIGKAEFCQITKSAYDRFNK